MNAYAFKLTFDLSRVCETSSYEALARVVPGVHRLIMKCNNQAAQNRSTSLKLSVRTEHVTHVSQPYYTAIALISGFTEPGALAFLNSCLALARDFNQDDLEVIVSYEGEAINAMLLAADMPDQHISLVGENCEYLQFM